MARTLVLLTTLLIAMQQGAALAAEVTCRKSPALTGQCRMVKGSLGLTPGLGVTVAAEDGTKIIIKAPPDSNADIAPPVMQNWLYWQSRTSSMRTRITGTFEICPLPSQINTAGVKDYGCINRGTKIAQDKTVSVN